ncbi:Uncharacterised protein [Salmonella bongori]|nr:Uncharacterised protein [Salmonella bongori]
MMKSVVEETQGESGLCCVSHKGQHDAGLYGYGVGGLTVTVRRGRLFQTGSIAQQLRFVSFFPREVFTTKVTVSRGFFVDRV